MTMTISSLATDVMSTIDTITDGNYVVYVAFGLLLSYGGFLWRRFTKAR